MWLATADAESHFLPTLVSHLSQHDQPGSLEPRGVMEKRQKDKAGGMEGRASLWESSNHDQDKRTTCQTLQQWLDWKQRRGTAM